MPTLVRVSRNEPLANLAGGEQLALAAGERGVVDADAHRDGGGVDVHECERKALLGVGDGLADEGILEAGLVR